jgi:enoyl-CoA hydratase/carnithine racemase
MIDLVLEGPGKNALSSTLMRELLARLDAAAGAPVLLTGAGDALSAGLNLVELAGFDVAGMRAYLELLERTIHALYLYPGPLVAFVNGHAIAGGCIFTLCCDLRVCSREPGVKIGLNEVALGLRFPRSVLQLVRRRVAPEHLDEVVLGAGLHDPQGALRLGLVDELGDIDLARARLAALANHPAGAYASAKADLRAGVLVDDPAQARAFLDEALPMWTSPALRERLLGFLSQRSRRG